MTDKYHKLCNTCPFGTIKLDSLQRNLNQLQEQVKKQDDLCLRAAGDILEKQGEIIKLQEQVKELEIKLDQMPHNSGWHPYRTRPIG